MKQVAILGGTFNPIHVGHLAAAQAVVEALKLDEVLFIPSYYPPHKSKVAVIEAKHRLAMVKLAIQDNKRFSVCDLEIKRKGKSYSIDTLRELKKLYPAKTKFYFIIGSDMLKGLSSWRRIEELAKLVCFVVVDRKGYIKSDSPYKVKNVAMFDLGLSSSYLRQSLKEGKSVRYLVPESVCRYISNNRLYAKMRKDHL